MEKLTPVQNKALEFIRSAVEENGRAPTFRELTKFMGFKAIGSAQDLVGALRKKGFLQIPEKQSARSLRLTEKAKFFPRTVEIMNNLEDVYLVPCLGAVPAGNPLEAIEERIGLISVSMSQFSRPKPDPKNLFALKANGLSMIEAGILNGDWLIVKSQIQADSGNIVIARMNDGDVTCKRLMQDKNGWFLKPENPNFKIIHSSKTNFEIIGRVLALHRTII